jgi:effector-binding domain-containing protein
MALAEGIEHKHIPATQVAYVRFHLKDRSELQDVLQELAGVIPAAVITGPPILYIQSFSSYTEGYAAEAGFPVSRVVEGENIRNRTIPALEVLALTHSGPRDSLRETKVELYQFARGNAFISDEFSREVYPGWPDPEGPVEIHFVVHNWNRLLSVNLERILGKKGRDSVLPRGDALPIDATPEQRFEWSRAAMHRLDVLADPHQKYDAVSSCAHVFPPAMLEMLQRVYADSRSRGDDALQAVDAVLAFMETDPGWNEKVHSRQGRVVYQTKGPADPEAHAAATTDAERRAAYCFCPVIRSRLDQGMPVTYCYCGAGWYRQQWETATGKPVTVEVVRSVLKGDMDCEFATHLSEDL